MQLYCPLQKFFIELLRGLRKYHRIQYLRISNNRVEIQITKPAIHEKRLSLMSRQKISP